MHTNFIAKRDSKMDLLKYYIKIGSFEDVKTIVSKDFNFDAERTDYILLKTSFLNKHKEITKILIEHNFRLNKSSLREQDTTPLHLAVKLDWKDIVQLLLQKGASVAIRESDSGMTPNQLSFSMKNYKLTDLMLPYDKTQEMIGTQVGSQLSFLMNNYKLTDLMLPYDKT